MHSFLVLPTVAIQGPAFGVEWLKLYAQRVFLLSQLLSDVTSITPKRKIVRIDRGRVERPPIAPLIVLFLALTEQGGRVLFVQ
jgi:hypothetical protein